MQMPLPITRDLVLVGGGHAHALVLRRWGMRPLPGVRLTVINPGPDAPYTGMLPGHVAGHYARADLEIDLVRLARFAGARLIDGRAEGIDRAAARVHVPGRPPVPYDVASIDIGISSGLPGLPGFAEHGVAAKPLGAFVAAWETFLDAVEAGRKPPEIAVIGAGVGGVELAFAMAFRLRAAGHAPRVALVDAGRALGGIGGAAAQVLRNRLTQEGIRLVEAAEPARVTAEALDLSDGRAVPAAFVVAAAGARPQSWLAETGLPLKDGFIRVDASLRSVGDPAIYAAGDCAHLDHAPRPKAGVFAVRAAPVLWWNLRADLSGSQRRAFHPQRDYLKLVSMGAKEAVADRSGLALSGGWVWRMKDRIDRAFIDRLRNLPRMDPPRAPADVARGVREELAGGKPICGGCGAKLGGAALAGVLGTLPAPARKDILSRPGDDAAVIAFGPARQVVTTDHLRAFTEDPWTLARIAAVHAMGDVWAMGAEPQAALATVILPRMRAPMQAAMLEEIMAGAAGVFADAGAEIAGGHSSIGAELTVGFTVTGIARAAPLTLAGARPGDRLILTKPIGSGTVLAGEMALEARGAWVAAALDEMMQAQGAASTILSGARAMTDVTGFGLAGHLMAMLEASGAAAALTLESVPLMAGAAELASRGIRSTLYPENRQVAARMGLTGDIREELLFDPQTAGGLLAALPREKAGLALRRLRAGGYRAASIGEVLEGAPFVTIR
jgi:selenide,water dikinase